MLALFTADHRNYHERIAFGGAGRSNRKSPKQLHRFGRALATERAKRMPPFVLECEVCASHRPFGVPQGDPADPATKNSIQKHCHTCRTMTNWTIAFPERRSGHERRQGPDRRSHKP